MDYPPERAFRPHFLTFRRRFYKKYSGHARLNSPNTNDGRLFMSGRFSIAAENVINEGKKLDKISEKMSQKRLALIDAMNDLPDSNGYIILKEVAKERAENLKTESCKINNLGLGLELIGNAYLLTEDRISNKGRNSSKYRMEIARIRAEMGTTMMESDAYIEGDEGYYGGNQMNFVKALEDLEHGDDRLFKKYYGWMKEIYPDLTEEEAKDMLYHMTTDVPSDRDRIDDIIRMEGDAGLTGVGCGYVAICNTIFQEYAGREDEFKRVFGFDYYDEDGHVNHDRMVIEIYTMAKKEGIGLNENGFPDGTNSESREDLLTAYLEEKGFDPDKMDEYYTYEDVDNLTAEDMKQYIEDGKQVIIGVHEEKLYNMDGSPAERLDAHAMTVTGYTDDGKIIVSSWGTEYYMNADDMDGNETYTVIDYDIPDRP